MSSPRGEKQKLPVADFSKRNIRSPKVATSVESVDAAEAGRPGAPGRPGGGRMHAAGDDHTHQRGHGDRPSDRDRATGDAGTGFANPATADANASAALLDSNSGDRSP